MVMKAKMCDICQALSIPCVDLWWCRSETLRHTAVLPKLPSLKHNSFECEYLQSYNKLTSTSNIRFTHHFFFFFTIHREQQQLKGVGGREDR